MVAAEEEEEGEGMVVEGGVLVVMFCVAVHGWCSLHCGEGSWKGLAISTSFLSSSSSYRQRAVLITLQVLLDAYTHFLQLVHTLLHLCLLAAVFISADRPHEYI